MSQQEVYSVEQWSKDLVKDVRFHDWRDDADDVDNRVATLSGLPDYNVTIYQLESTDFSVANQNALREQIRNRYTKPDFKCILEIGVHNNPTGVSSTSIFLKEKAKSTIYIGVDLDDKSSLDNPENNVYTIRTRSEDYKSVWALMEKLGVTTIDFLFIDGWHSINQCYYDWEYSKDLGKNGVVGFHDTAYHPGPYLFINAIDTTKWDVIPNAVKDPNDYGIGFAIKKD